MAIVNDVAKFILECKGEITAMKLQKLMFYAQAWNLVWEEKELFEEDFEAWANGPVLPSLYSLHRGMFRVTPELIPEANSANLSQLEKQNIEKVLSFYGEKTAQWLSNLTHQEDPWINAREGLSPEALSGAKITKASMHEYYSSL
jgi:uncharacterized phage-associated protein